MGRSSLSATARRYKRGCGSSIWRGCMQKVLVAYTVAERQPGPDEVELREH